MTETVGGYSGGNQDTARTVGYAHAATLAGGDDLAVTLAGQLREAREAIQRVRAWASRPRDWPEDASVRARTAYALAQQDALAALDLPDGTS